MAAFNFCKKFDASLVQIIEENSIWVGDMDYDNTSLFMNCGAGEDEIRFTLGTNGTITVEMYPATDNAWEWVSDDILDLLKRFTI
jgi:hypothetical protein